MDKKFTCIIPVRYKSTRFPGKPLVKIFDEPMISIVYNNAKKSSFVNNVIVATDDSRIYDYCKDNHMEVVYTSESCKNGSERVAEVAKNIEDDYIFEMQGDQPLVTADVIDTFFIKSLPFLHSNKNIDVLIPYADCIDESEDILKVVVTTSEKLVFQSRQNIKTGYRTLGLYIWRKPSLLKFADLPISQIEEAEQSHPIRLYVNDFIVQGVLLDGSDWIEVDRPYQVEQVENIMKKNNTKYD